MEIITSGLRYVHLIGFAALTFGVLVQFGRQQKVISRSILYGAVVQLLSGFGLIFALASLDRDMNGGKLMAKFGIVVVIVVFALIFRKKSLSQLQYYVLLVLTLAASLTAVFV